MDHIYCDLGHITCFVWIESVYFEAIPTDTGECNKTIQGKESNTHRKKTPRILSTENEGTIPSTASERISRVWKFN